MLIYFQHRFGSFGVGCGEHRGAKKCSTAMKGAWQWATSQSPRCPVPSWACEVWGLTPGHRRPARLTSTLTSKTTTGLLRPPTRRRTLVWHLLFTGIHSLLGDPMSCIYAHGRFTGASEGVARRRVVFWNMLHYWKRSLAHKGPFWTELCHHYSVLTFTSTEAPSCAADLPQWYKHAACEEVMKESQKLQ